MITDSSIALAGFIAWTLALLLLMETVRSGLVLRGEVAANGFTPDNADLSPFMQRLARAHANCIEGFPIFGGLLLLAIATDRTSVTDALAYWFLLARVVQSLIHLASTSAVAVTARFCVFSVQLAIGAYWVFRLAFT